MPEKDPGRNADLEQQLLVFIRQSYWRLAELGPLGFVKSPPPAAETSIGNVERDHLGKLAAQLSRSPFSRAALCISDSDVENDSARSFMTDTLKSLSVRVCLSSSGGDSGPPAAARKSQRDYKHLMSVIFSPLFNNIFYDVAIYQKPSRVKSSGTHMSSKVGKSCIKVLTSEMAVAVRNRGGCPHTPARENRSAVDRELLWFLLVSVVLLCSYMIIVRRP
ncbi:hypothetical protein MSAN_00323300 [Mycena sanguinolenta]|uniref:Uncharacterized protein n=1 Tax=Mycena sanguinolenta TaxID=230812 RepID=A0A8H6Z8R5_9AGAR|nr:hypothetical protein MSAN_00323300 [Mycena sanguinolenta]